MTRDEIRLIERECFIEIFKAGVAVYLDEDGGLIAEAERKPDERILGRITAVRDEILALLNMPARCVVN